MKRASAVLVAACAVMATVAGLSEQPARSAEPLDLPPQSQAATSPTEWTARWIAVAGASPFDYGVYHFRRTFRLDPLPKRFVVHASADNRYQLFVNGSRVVWGPARGDLDHWRYETIDLSKWLRPGSNTLAAVVWNFADLAPQAQQTWQTGFLLQGDRDVERVADTGAEWVGVQNHAYQPIEVTSALVRGYWAAGPGERIDAQAYPWGWEQPGFDDGAWPKAKVGPPARPRSDRDSPSRWMLVPRTIPLMEEHPERLKRVRIAEGVQPPAGFLEKSHEWRVPARTRVRLLLDRDAITTGWPEIEVSGGKGARVALRFAEALWTGEKGLDKGHRDEVAGKVFAGYGDELRLDGGDRRVFRALWWRTFRYLELTIETADQPLTVHDLRHTYTGYPFERRARFIADRADLQRILDVGWHTARLCAHETYMDCPYYEQLQYAGDTRVQALVSLYMSGDSRLVENAIAQLDDSRTAEGLTFSRAPSRLPQYIPPFSLWWIGMLHDYWRYGDNAAFVRTRLPGVASILAYFANRQVADGRLREVGWWNFVDWTSAWRSGVPPMARDGSSAALDLQLILAYDEAAHLEAAFGSPGRVASYRAAASKLRAAVQRTYWVGARGLFADTSDLASFSQHVNALAVLANVVEGNQARGVMQRTLEADNLTPASIYFKYYLHQAVARAGLGDRYLELLEDWHQMLEQGLTTWAETLEKTRSDCHAWGASPNIELFRIVLGVDSAAPGFREIRVRPFLGPLTHVEGSVPHPSGDIQVKLERRGSTAVHAELTLPPGTSGSFEWQGRAVPLRAGTQTLVTSLGVHGHSDDRR
jgi:alpha-L-rhamnosidase